MFPYARCRCLYVAVGLCLFAATAQSQPGGEAEGMFRSLDGNQDGKLTMEDAGPGNRTMLERVFEMAGKPRTGTMTRAEFQTVFERHRAGNRTANVPAGNSGSSGLAALLPVLDRNRDGRLSKAEFERLSQAFSRLDADQDGQLSSEELQASERLGDTPAATTATDEMVRPRSAPAPLTGTAVVPVGRDSGLSGVWRGRVVRSRGENPNEGEMEVELTIEGNRITGKELSTRRAPGGIGSGTYTLQGQGRSGNLDAEGTSGPQDGRTYLGIYELEGDTLRWCVSNRGRQRPETMATDRGNYLLVLRRQRS